MALELAVAQAVISHNIGYEAGYLGKELGIHNDRIQHMLRKMDKNREKVRVSKPRKKRKVIADPHYGAGEH